MPNQSLPGAAALLARQPLFQLFSRDQVAAMAAQGDVLRFALGERIFRRSEPALHVYLIVRGRARFTRGDPSGRRVTVGIGNAGDLLGDEALTAATGYALTCNAADDITLCRLAVAPLLDLIGLMPRVDFRLPAIILLHRLLYLLRSERPETMPDGDLAAALAKALRPKRIAAGTSVALAGHQGEEWLFIRAGMASRRFQDGGTQGLGPGECLGTDALLGLPYREDVLAITSLTCLCLGRDDFERLSATLGESPSVMRSLGSAFTWVGQRGAVDCGAAALAMAARRLGRRMPIEDVTRHLDVDERGANLERLTQAALALGLPARAMQANADALSAMALPAIALLHEHHYVVVYEFNSESALIGDPLAGLVTWSRAEFLQQWSGFVLALEAPG